MGVAILQPLWPMAGHYTACGGWRAATRPVAGRYAACMAGRYAGPVVSRPLRGQRAHIAAM